MATEKHAGGRPTKYLETYNEQARKLCLLGATDDDIASFFGVDAATINRWKLSHPQFCESLKDGKQLADANVAERLFNRAMGYEHPETDVKMYNGEIILTELTKRYPPDTTAAIFWLKNRQREYWRDKQDVEVSVTKVSDVLDALETDYRDVGRKAEGQVVATDPPLQDQG